jgi:YD repeat-containing protein
MFVNDDLVKLWYDFDDSDRLIASHDSRGLDTYFKYDDENRLVYEECKFKNVLTIFTIRYVYYRNAVGNNCIYTKDIFGFESYYEYNNAGNLIYTNNSNNEKVDLMIYADNSDYPEGYVDFLFHYDDILAKNLCEFVITHELDECDRVKIEDELDDTDYWYNNIISEYIGTGFYSIYDVIKGYGRSFTFNNSRIYRQYKKYWGKSKYKWNGFMFKLLHKIKK